MRGEPLPSTEILQAIRLLTEHGQVFEIRIITPSPVRSGYYNDPEKAARDIEVLDAGSQAPSAIYITINPCHPDLLHKREPNKIHPIRERTDTTTNDAQIARRRWLYIDLDVEREVRGISSTDTEKKIAFDRAREIKDFLKEEMEFPDPLEADSGNGAHLLYRIDLPNNEKSTELVVGVLNALNQVFPAAKDCPVNVDTTTSNPARICKMYGTVVRKGTSSLDRPHRRSHILASGSGEVVPMVSLKAVADLFHEPLPEEPKVKKKKGKAIDLKTYLDEHRDKLPTFTERSRPAYTYFVVFDDCPWGGDKSHKAFAGQLKNGSIVSKCHDYNCGGAGKGKPNHWLELREKVEGKKIPKKKADVIEEEKDSSTRIKPWHVAGDLLYITVRGPDGYFFANNNGSGVQFIDKIEMGETIIKPRVLPRGPDGQEIPVVGVPLREKVESAKDISPADLVKLLDEHIRKYVDLTDLDREMGIYYILFTWFYPKTNTVPYYRAIGDTGKGKSRIILVLSDLCFYPISASGASSTSGIMRFKELWKGTLVVDESDLKDGDTTHDLIKYFNLGFERGKYYLKTDKTDVTRQEIFDPFCPKLFGMRHPFADNATEGRCLSVSPLESTRKDLPIILPKAYYQEMETLRGTVARFVITNWSKVDGEQMIDLHDLGVEPRIQQLAMPLSIVIQLLPDGEERFKTYIRARQREVQETRAASFEGVLFNLLVDLANGTTEPPEKYEKYKSREGQLQVVTAPMIAASIGITSVTASKTLQSIGLVVEQTPIYVDQGYDKKPMRKNVRALVFPDEHRWVEATHRYRPPPDEDTQQILWDPCPDALKSAKWVGEMGKESVAGVAGVAGSIHSEEGCNVP